MPEEEDMIVKQLTMQTIDDRARPGDDPGVFPFRHPLQRPLNECGDHAAPGQLVVVSDVAQRVTDHGLPGQFCRQQFTCLHGAGRDCSTSIGRLCVCACDALTRLASVQLVHFYTSAGRRLNAELRAILCLDMHGSGGGRHALPAGIARWCRDAELCQLRAPCPGRGRSATTQRFLALS